jgi:hypothetical protein
MSGKASDLSIQAILEQRPALVRDLGKSHAQMVPPFDLLLLVNFAAIGIDAVLVDAADEIGLDVKQEMQVRIGVGRRAIDAAFRHVSQPDSPQSVQMAAVLVQVIKDRYTKYLVEGEQGEELPRNFPP